MNIFASDFRKVFAMSESAVNDLTVVNHIRFPKLDIIPEISNDVPDDPALGTHSSHEQNSIIYNKD